MNREPLFHVSPFDKTWSHNRQRGAGCQASIPGICPSVSIRLSDPYEDRIRCYTVGRLEILFTSIIML